MDKHCISREFFALGMCNYVMHQMSLYRLLTYPALGWHSVIQHRSPSRGRFAPLIVGYKLDSKDKVWLSSKRCDHFGDIMQDIKNPGLFLEPGSAPIRLPGQLRHLISNGWSLLK
jgi:hypothetical protein